MDKQSSEMLVQASVALLQVFFTNMKLAGKSDDQIKAIYYQERAEFRENHPDLLPDV
jgi:hypothetical protein